VVGLDQGKKDVVANERVSENTEVALQVTFSKALTIHDHRRASDKRSKGYKIHGGLLEGGRLRELAEEYADFQKAWGKDALDTPGRSIQSCVLFGAKGMIVIA
jgi:hypothetical protein